MRMSFLQALRHPYPRYLASGPILLAQSAAVELAGRFPLTGLWWLWLGGGAAWGLVGFVLDCIRFPVGDDGLRTVSRGGWRSRPWGLTSYIVLLLVLPHVFHDPGAYFLASSGLGVGILAGSLWWYPRWRLLEEAYAEASANLPPELTPAPPR